MKCKKVKQKINQFLIEKKVPLTKPASHHISECPDCREYYESILHISKLTCKLKDTEPSLANPTKLTEDIMLEINKVARKNQNNISFIYFNSMNIQRFLAAASICLFMIFGYEQYIVLDKITQLEKENQFIGKSFQSQNSSLNGTIEGFLLLKLKINNTKSEKLFKNLNLDQYNNDDLLAAYRMVKQGGYSSKELKMALGSDFSYVEAKDIIEKMKSYDNESLKTINNLKYKML